MFCHVSQRLGDIILTLAKPALSASSTSRVQSTALLALFTLPRRKTVSTYRATTRA